MKINLIKQNNVLVPSLEEDEEKLLTWKRGDILQVEIKRPRNAAFNRKWRALVRYVFQNQEIYNTEEDLLFELKLKCGHYREHITTKGEIIYDPQSLSFASMDEMEFSMFYNKAIDVILKYFIDTTKEDVDEIVDGVLRFT